MKNCLYIVVPCYNEEEVLRETAKRLKEKLNGLIKEGKIANNSRITFVNDGSKDKTWDIISELHNEDKIFSGVNLSRNRGHQNALLAGLMTVKDYADMVISMDADLQDDINAVDGMVDKYMQGADIVYGVRNKRETDTFFKRFTAEGYYKVMKKMGVDLVFNHADYRLMSKRALKGLEDFKEVNLFLRGIVPQIGYKTDIETYERGAGYTLSSGTGACAAVASAYRLGVCGKEVIVTMPGGELLIEIKSDFTMYLTGRAEKVGTFYVAEHFFV